jgi:hypothetical protein
VFSIPDLDWEPISTLVLFIGTPLSDLESRLADYGRRVFKRTVQ